jgi:hypothetical protein
MTRPSRRRTSEETMNERASSCVRAPMSRHCRAASPSADYYYYYYAPSVDPF